MPDPEDIEKQYEFLSIFRDLYIQRLNIFFDLFPEADGEDNFENFKKATNGLQEVETVVATTVQGLAAAAAATVRENTFVSSVLASTDATLQEQISSQAFQPFVEYWHDIKSGRRRSNAKPQDFSKWLKQSIHPLFDWIGTNMYGELVDLQSVRKISQEVTEHLESRDFKAAFQTQPVETLWPYASAEMGRWSARQLKQFLADPDGWEERLRAIPPRAGVKAPSAAEPKNTAASGCGTALIFAISSAFLLFWHFFI